jgi:hypothetical protein
MEKARMDKLTWRELVKIEPELGVLLKEIRQVKDLGGPSFCANQIWYSQYKERLCRLAGWEAQKDDPRLRSEAAYDLAYDKLYYTLPDCRNCNC